MEISDMKEAIPNMVLYNDKNLYYFIEYSDLKDLSEWEEQYFSALKGLYEENTARCIINRFLI